jgi:hypothetical protein
MPYQWQWATAGYYGAINSGQTICGILFGAVVFLGYLNGKNAEKEPSVKDAQRIKAIESVERLFKEFNDKFGTSDCQTLIGCDYSKEEDRERYRAEKIYEKTCFPQFKFVLSHCLADLSEKEND